MFVDQNNPFVLSFLRKTPHDRESVLVILNMSAEPRKFAVHLAPYGITQKTARVLLSAPEESAQPVSLADLFLAPFGVLIAAVP